ncbi:MAG: hypothetical protein WKF36_04895 [Candidatus Nitrosocosmicus sp.]
MVENQCDSTCAVPNRMGESVTYNQNRSNACGCQTSTTGNCNSCSSCCETDPIETAKQLLERSFFAALKEVHVEKIKKIIERDWGDTIDRTAELAVKTIERQWHSSVSASNAKKELYEELGRIMASYSNKGK